MTNASEILPPLRAVIDRYGLMAKKSLGQNFILDANLTAKIVRAAGDLSGCNVLEVGPGPGGLTRALLCSSARTVTAVERDDRCLAALADLTAAFPGRLFVHAGDALAMDLAGLCAAPRAIVANLPYNIATPLLIGWLKQPGAFESMTLMFQREVALRLTAVPGTKDYGRLSVLTQWLAAPARMFDLPPSAFVPSPKVTSTVVRLVPQMEEHRARLVPALEHVTAAAFGQRRKMLRQSLKTLTPAAETLLHQAGLPATARAEDIDVAGFVRLAEVWREF